MGKMFPWMLRGLIFLSILGLFPLGVVSHGPRAAMAQLQLDPRFFVIYYSSHNQPAQLLPGSSEATSTVVTISSLGSGVNCAVEVVWRDNIGNNVCTTLTDRIISRGFVNHCSRAVETMAMNFPRCDQTCAPPLLKNEGPAIVSVTTGCQASTAVDVRINYTAYVPGPDGAEATTEIVLGAHSPQVLKISGGSLE